MKTRFVVVSEDKELYFDQKIKLLNLIPENDRKNYLCAKVNNRIRELTYDVHYDAKVDFLSINDEEAMFIYENSLRYIIAMALYQINPNIQLKYSYYESRSIYGLILNDDIKMDQTLLDKLKDKINEIVKNDYPFVRKIVPNDEAEIIYRQFNMLDKIDLLKYRPEKTVHFYTCNGYYNYMYGYMAPSTGYINKYKLELYQDGFIIQYPRSECNGEIPPFEPSPKFGKTLDDSYAWARMVQTDTVTKINHHIETSKDVDFINLCEAHHNNMLSDLGRILKSKIDTIRLICIAGPSSSGKTTFSNRLRSELLSYGIQPIRISLDDYYLEDIKYLIIGIISLIVSLYLFIKIVKRLSRLSISPTDYDKTLKKILNQYDRLIVTTSSMPNLEKNNIIKLKEFVELLDAKDNLHKPIFFIEVTPHQKAYFFIQDDDKIILFTLKNIDNK